MVMCSPSERCPTVLLVKVIHPYTPANNDELRLERGEMVTVSRQEEGGWWEGTSATNGRTGWFPSNYVEPLSAAAPNSNQTPSNNTTPTIPPSPSAWPALPRGSEGDGGWSPSSVIGCMNGSAVGVHLHSTSSLECNPEYRAAALKDLVQSETTHLQELQRIWDCYLTPLQHSDILNSSEFGTVVGNFRELLEMQGNLLLRPLQQQQRDTPPETQSIGNVFMQAAPTFEKSHKSYCSNHPKAVQVVERHREHLSAFMESLGCKKPGVLTLITALSQPFRRLEKYPLLLQELGRHLEEFHKDRGDVQRSIEYYRQIENGCSVLRKQKEMELEVLSGAIKDWEGSDVAALGEIILMSLVHLGSGQLPRYLVLFPSTLLMLSYSTEENTLVYEGKLPLSGILLKPTADNQSAFLIYGPMIEEIRVECESRAVRDGWMDQLGRMVRSSCGQPPARDQSLVGCSLTPGTKRLRYVPARVNPPFNPLLLENLKHVRQLVESQQEAGKPNPTQPEQVNASVTLKVSSGQPLCYVFDEEEEVSDQQNLQLLNIVDSFCRASKHSVMSLNLSSPTPPPVQRTRSAEERSSAPVSPANQHFQPMGRTLATVVEELRQEVRTLRSEVAEEKQMRAQLQRQIQNSPNNNNASNCPNPLSQTPSNFSLNNNNNSHYLSFNNNDN